MSERNLKTKKRTKPVEMVSREDYEQIIHVLKQVNGLFSMMDYNPEAEVVNDIHKQVKGILDRHDGYESEHKPK